MSGESAEAFARRLERETAEQFHKPKDDKAKPRAKKASKKSIDATESAVFQALREHPALGAGTMFALDTFSNMVRVRVPIPVKGLTGPVWKEGNLTDVDISHLIVWLQDNGYVKVGRMKVQAAVEMEAHRNSYSSAQEELGRQPAWDGEVRIDRFWTEVAGAITFEAGMSEQQVFDRARYIAAIGRSFFIGMVARIKKPGCKVDNVPILEGEQGTLKSTLLRTICLRPEWFTDNLGGDLSSKDAKQHLAGKLIVELAELHQLGKTQLGALKSFLTMQEDEYRPPYGRNPTFQPRQCVFAGTTNSGHYLSDESGNRRYWPIECGEINIELAEQWKAQLYAEALVAFEAGEKPYLAKDVEILASEEQDKRITDDPWEAGVKTVVERVRREAIAAGNGVFYVTAVDGLEAIETNRSLWDRAKQLRVSLILRKLGGKNKRLPRDGTEQKRGFCFDTAPKGRHRGLYVVSDRPK